MPPVKVPKKPLKSMEREGGLVMKKKKDKKTSRKNYDSFSIYLFKVLKACTDGANMNIGISRKSILIMNNFVNDILEQIACEAGRLIAHGKKTTLNENEIRTSTKLLVPGELGKHALIEGEKALRNYKNNSSSSQSY